MQGWGVREASPGVESQNLVPFYSSHLPWPAQEDSEEGGLKQPDPERSRADLLRTLERAPQPHSLPVVAEANARGASELSGALRGGG